ncbi:4-hydroxy-3-methylbut-2-enyl diphosphate reductase [Olsenella sp. HMSC062G07]|uniref:4-hydroxy-3-methylbut-2-enyl diphosphate reductase n=1 Tax=Olsenella sp. HMSC062G07 TaxID=1739330 RepID=UPI0008A519DA|nr:4-hydroxy-3-methylbut-2-enyl diphosphate reductase [Olsenella sp. HMSC062G07]OFK24409.1 hydroxymethylbutenyl pyrophosphate reductase [Olsenella sp. HMSC062G07]
MTPTIRVADEAGACYGVNRALDMARAATREAPAPIHTLGPLIHNPSVVAQLAAEGVGVVEDPSDQPGGTLLLRCHGVTPSQEREARATHELVLDATCPFVVRAHQAAERLTSEGYQVIVLGEKGHPEVEGTLAHAPDAVVLSGAGGLDGMSLGRKVGVVVQTTQARSCLRDLVAALVGRCAELRVIDTICEATSLRQEAAARLAGASDVMVVIGGRNSANTTRLARICAERCPATHHIELPGELRASWFEGAARIGVTAGASTPQTQIDEVVHAIGALVGDGRGA